MKHAPLLMLGWAAALLLAFHPMLLSGLAQVPGDLGDARLVNYLLEHGWLWLLHQPLHQDFWSPPIFYPAANTAAYSDLLITAGPFYWCWRAVGLPMDTAFQLWLLTISSLNYLAMYAFLGRVLRLRTLAAALGAVLFTAGNSRVAEIVHPQLYIHFYSVVAVYGLVRFFETTEAPPTGRMRPWLWLGVFCLAAVLQIYASYYLGWFLGLGVLVAGAVACARGPTRRGLFAVRKRQRWTVCAWTGATAVLVAPLAWHYLLAAREVGMRNWGAAGLPSPWAWFILDPTSWLYGRLTFLQAAPGAPGLDQLGVGFLAPALAVWGLWRRRRSPIFYYLLWTAVALVMLVTTVGPVTLWIVVYGCVPGAAALRAAYRVCLVVLFVIAAGAACFVEDRKRVWTAAVLALLCVLEQGRTPPTFSKEESRRRVAELAARIPPGGAAFLYTPRGDPDSFLERAFVQVDAMWAELETGEPTVNGYSGAVPPDYAFVAPIIRDEDDLEERQKALNEWCERHGKNPATVVWIHD